MRFTSLDPAEFRRKLECVVRDAVIPSLNAYQEGDLVMQGLADAGAGRWDTVLALLAQIGLPRLAAAGLFGRRTAPLFALCGGGDAAPYCVYNSLLRRMFRGGLELSRRDSLQTPAVTTWP